MAVLEGLLTMIVVISVMSYVTYSQVQTLKREVVTETEANRRLMSKIAKDINYNDQVLEAEKNRINKTIQNKTDELAESAKKSDTVLQARVQNLENNITNTLKTFDDNVSKRVNETLNLSYANMSNVLLKSLQDTQSSIAIQTQTQQEKLVAETAALNRMVAQNQAEMQTNHANLGSSVSKNTTRIDKNEADIVQLKSADITMGDQILKARQKVDGLDMLARDTSNALEKTNMDLGILNNRYTATSNIVVSQGTTLADVKQKVDLALNANTANLQQLTTELQQSKTSIDGMMKDPSFEDMRRVTRAVTIDAQGNLTTKGPFGVAGANEFELGKGVQKEANAGKIAYQKFTADALDVVGAGTTATNRKIKFWNEGGADFVGRVRVNRTVNDAYPRDMQEGVHAMNVYVNGSVAAGENGQVAGSIDNKGNLTAANATVNGSQQVKGMLKVNRANTDKYPNGWGAGMHAWDVYANGTIGAGRDGNVAAYINSAGDAKVNSMHVDGKLLVSKGDGNWNWVQVNGNHGDTLYFGSDETNRGIWADGNRPFSIYNKGINALSVNTDGSVNISNKLFFNDASTSTNPNGPNNSDPYFLEKIHHAGNNSELRLTMNDDWEESFQIWADSCRTTGCAGKGEMRHMFRGDGYAFHHGDVEQNGANTIHRGGNNWIVHTPNDGRRNMWIAPSSAYGNRDWAWHNALRLDPDGTINTNKICVGTRCMTEKDMPAEGTVSNGKFSPPRWDYVVHGQGHSTFLAPFSTTFDAPSDGYMIISWIGHVHTPNADWAAYYTILINGENPLSTPKFHDSHTHANPNIGSSHMYVQRHWQELSVHVHVKVRKGQQTIQPAAAIGHGQWVHINGSGIQWTFIPISSGGSQTVDLPLVNGWRAYGGEYGTPTVTKMGNLVVVEGLLAGDYNRSTHMATLPQGMRPSKRLIFSLNNHEGQARVDVLTNGDIHWIAGSRNHGWMSLSGITFRAN